LLISARHQQQPHNEQQHPGDTGDDDGSVAQSREPGTCHVR